MKKSIVQTNTREHTKTIDRHTTPEIITYYDIAFRYRCGTNSKLYRVYSGQVSQLFND